MQISPGARLVEARSGRELGGATLETLLCQTAEAVDTLPTGAVFCLLGRDLAAIVRYVGVRRAARAVLPLDPAVAVPALADLVRRFAPAAVLGVSSETPAPPGYRGSDHPHLGPAWIRLDEAAAVGTELGLLLLTSGSTGTPKLVRLSVNGLEANADAVVSATGIDDRTTTITALPLFYSFGMSVLHSHLRAGAKVVVSGSGVVDREFWQAATDHRVTSLATVPHHLEMLDRMRWSVDRGSALRVIATSGGAVRPALASRLHQELARKSGRLYLMYGQTEAGPRITVLHPGRTAAKPGSVGSPVDGNRLTLRTSDGRETTGPDEFGEIICRGPGIMLGYATCPGDLTAGDTQRGVLATGDLGHLDGDGDLWLSGRSSRVAKVFGVRVNLDAVERSLPGPGGGAALGVGDRVRIFLTDRSRSRPEVAARVAGAQAVHPAGIDVVFLDELPVRANGKTDYRALEEMS